MISSTKLKNRFRLLLMGFILCPLVGFQGAFAEELGLSKVCSVEDIMEENGQPEVAGEVDQIVLFNPNSKGIQTENPNRQGSTESCLLNLSVGANHQEVQGAVVIDKSNPATAFKVMLSGYCADSSDDQKLSTQQESSSGSGQNKMVFEETPLQRVESFCSIKKVILNPHEQSLIIEGFQPDGRWEDRASLLGEDIESDPTSFRCAESVVEEYSVRLNDLCEDTE